MLREWVKGGPVAKLVIEVPDELKGLGEAIAAMVARVQGTLAVTGGGKAVDYAAVEIAISKESGKIECEAHRGILQSLDMDVPAVVIGGVRYNRVGRCE